MNSGRKRPKAPLCSPSPVFSQSQRPSSIGYHSEDLITGDYGFFGKAALTAPHCMSSEPVECLLWVEINIFFKLIFRPHPAKVVPQALGDDNHTIVAVSVVTMTGRQTFDEFE